MSASILSADSDPAAPDSGTPSSYPILPHESMVVGGRYTLVTPRGRGGIGEVWEAEQAPTGRKVALKLMLPGWQSDPSVRKRFVREGRLASTMQHRHIVHVLEAGEARGGLPFIAMELLRGPSLDVVVEQEGPLPWARVKRILLQLCGALDHAHGLKIIHRDVKPSNVVLASEPGEPDRCKLVDFGIAKQSLLHVHTQPLTGEGQMLGSPGFMSPEQLQGRPTDHRGDIYALACTGFYLLTGRIPFGGRSLPELLHNALYGLPRPLDGLDVPDPVRHDIEAVLHRALHRDPEGRFASILDLVVALGHVGRTSLPRWSRADESSAPPGELPGSTPPPDTPTAVVQPARHLEALLRASDVPTQATASLIEPAPPSGKARPASPTPRGVISTQSHSRVLIGQATADRVSWTGPAGFVELARIPADILVVHMSGQVGPAAAWLFEQQLGSLLSRHRPAHLFWHLGELESFPSEVRDATLRCLTEHRECIASAHVLNGPGLVGMSVSLAIVALGGRSNAYDDPEAWRAALDAWAGGGHRS